MRSATAIASSGVWAIPLRGRLSASLVEKLVEAAAVLGAVDGVGARAEQA